MFRLPLTMNSRKGVDTLAHRNSPSIVLRRQKHQYQYFVKEIERTIDNTVMESFGSGVEYISPDGFIIVGIGGLSVPGSVFFPIEKEKLGLAFLKLLSDTFPSNRRTPDGSWALGMVPVPSRLASGNPKVLDGADCLAALISLIGPKMVVRYDDKRKGNNHALTSYYLYSIQFPRWRLGWRRLQRRTELSRPGFWWLGLDSRVVTTDLAISDSAKQNSRKVS